MPITFSGLSSGLDTASIVDKLVALERRTADGLTSRQSDLTTQRSIVNSLSAAVAALGTAARGMDLDSEIRPRAATLSDTGKVAVAVAANAAVGVHSLRVKQLAVAEVRSSRLFDTATAGTLGTGGVDITVNGTTKAVNWDSTDTLASIATKINGASAGVSASVLFDGAKHRLVVTANATGTANVPTFVDRGDGLDLANPANVNSAAKDAILSIDGIDVTRSTNVISDALSGTTFTLNGAHAATDADTKATVALDKGGLTDKIKALVTAYNGVNSALHIQLDYNGTTKGTNTLFGDSTLRQLQGALASTMSRAWGGANLGMLGLSRDKTGALTFDETKLTAALQTDPEAVSNVFVTGGFAAAVGTLADSYTQSGTGLFATKAKSFTDRFNSIQKQIDRINKGADAMQARLEKQFTSLERAMSNLQAQSAYLTRTLG